MSENEITNDKGCLKGSTPSCCSAPEANHFVLEQINGAGPGCGCNASGLETELRAARLVSDKNYKLKSPSCDCDTKTKFKPLPMASAGADEPCCGPPQGLPSSPHDRAGYTLCHFVEGFIQTPAGEVPRVATGLQWPDFCGKVRARIGIRRDRYRVAPGLYAVGNPDPDSPVLVTANYKLSFDSLRQELKGINVWIMVLDTHGVNVWCAAGKKNFSSEEVVRQVNLCDLSKVVRHRQLILPQLSAPGVSAHRVKKGCGFSVKWGPVRAVDLREFFRNENRATSAMRQVTFTLGERLVLIPVELMLIFKPSLWVLLTIFFLSGLNSDIFSLNAAWSRGSAAASAYLLGIFSGAVAVPILLPWLPGRQFFLKGIWCGLVSGMLLLLFADRFSGLELLSLLLLGVSVSSYAAMNFTGATPFTSPSGVEKEMRQGMPLQMGAVFFAVIFWIVMPFIK